MSPHSRLERILCIGEVYASAIPLELRTLLGSCVAVCLFDPVARAGGMNHFALPDEPDGAAATPVARFGLPAMLELLDRLRAVGGIHQRLLATIIGGGHLLSATDVVNGVARRNVAFARSFLGDVRIAIVAEDVGGHHARQVRFHTDTGGIQVAPVETAASRARSSIIRGARHG